jgi:hypothetical protein
MTLSHNKTYGPARQREHDVMCFLARVVHGVEVFSGEIDFDELRQLGYAAYLSQGRVCDPGNRLGIFARECLSITKDIPKTVTTYRDPVQERWGAMHWMDPRKLRTELPLHIRKLMVDR